MRQLRTLVVGLCITLLVLGCTLGDGTAPGATRITDRSDRNGPRVLCVTAHPDDETVFAATLYKISTHLRGACDIALVTNGEGGFKYSTLADRIYDLELTDEEVGRRELPRIRREEMQAACRLLEVRDVFFLNQLDHRYTQDVGEVLKPNAQVWELGRVRRQLHEIIEAGRYDFIFTMAPVEKTHGHHQAATILACEVVESLPPERRPAVLCARVVTVDAPRTDPPGIAEYPATQVRRDVGPWTFDRTQKFGFRERLDYRVVVNLVIAAHRSQGTMQLAMNRGDREQFFLFALSGSGAAERVTRLFKSLEERQFPTKVYGESAGTNATTK